MRNKTLVILTAFIIAIAMYMPMPSFAGDTQHEQGESATKAVAEKADPKGGDSGEEGIGEKEPGDQTSGDKSSGEKASGNKTSGDQTSGDQASGDKSSGEKTPGDQASEKGSAGKDAGKKDSEKKDVKKDAEAKGPETKAPEAKDPETKAPETKNPESKASADQPADTNAGKTGPAAFAKLAKNASNAIPLRAASDWGWGNPEHTVRWDLTEEGQNKTLTFTVLEGASTDKEKAITRVLDSDGNAVTSDFKNSITGIKISDGITGIGWKALYDRNSNAKPAYDDSYTVNKSETGVFQDFANLKKVETCSSIKRIGWSAFRRCYSLESFDFSKLTNLEEIMNQAFSPCGLKDVDLSKCTSLKVLHHAIFSGASATAAQHGITSVTLPANLEVIGSTAFTECRNLKHVTFEDISKVKTVYNSAFKGKGSNTGDLNPIEYIADKKTMQRAATRNAAAKLFTGISDETPLPTDTFDYTALEEEDWPLSVAVKDKTTVYNGNGQKGYEISSVEGAGDDTCTVTGLKAGHKLSITNYTPSSGTDASEQAYDNGSFPEVPELDAIFEGYDYGINYVTGTMTPGKLTINKLDKVTVNVTGKTGKTEYSGVQQKVSGYDFAVADPEGFNYTAEDFTFSGSDKAERKNAGKTSMGLNAKQFENTNANIAEVEFIVTDGWIEITKKQATVTTGSAEKKYDGKPLTESTASFSGSVAGEVIAVTATGTITDVGSVPNTYSIDWGTADSGNYEITENLGTLTVTEPDPEPTTDPTKPSTDPTKPSTDPTKPTTEPTKPSTDPTSPTTDPTHHNNSDNKDKSAETGDSSMPMMALILLLGAAAGLTAAGYNRRSRRNSKTGR